MLSKFLDLMGYEHELKRERDAQSILAQKIEDATNKGKAEGKVEGAKLASAQIAQNLLAQGMDSEQVQAATGLSAEEISALKTSLTEPAYSPDLL